jgi:hypothetical protein
MPDLAVILVDLGIVALVVGVAAAWNRVWFARDGSAFGCRVALMGPTWTSRHYPRWSRLKTRAKWVDDVLIIQVGPLWTRTLHIPVHLPLDTQIHDETRGSIRRLGPHPQSLLMRPDAGAALLVAVRATDRNCLVGPFLAAAVAGLPSAPRSDRRRKL